MKLEDLQDIMTVLKESDLNHIEYEKDEIKILMKKSKIAPVRRIQNLQDENIKEEKKEIVEIKSYNVGRFFYRKKDDRYVLRVGKKIKEGSVLGYIESVGLRTDIISSVSGRIVEIMLPDGSLADYGKILVKIERD